MSQPPATISETARRVLDVEMRGLEQLAQDLPGDFTAFIEAVLSMSGRLIVSGIGKSAHIGHKISATLASTGTPSLFVHATEASHGDLGMIVPGDIAIVISNSGQTRELQDLVSYCKRFDIPMAGISANPDSVLMRAATYQLLIPKAEEACSIGMAPTTSTTITLALGDAIAVALMEQRGFTADHFKNFHPGGKLGMQLATVGDLMHGGNLPLVAGDTPMSDVLLAMTAHGLGAALVVRDGQLSGFITDGDLRRHMDDLLSKTAADIATKDPTTMHPDDFAAEAMAVLNRLKVNVLPILDQQGAPVGLLHMQDLVRAGVV
ncbi:KpsF/GutQ family sugar-phosphate isomerase [Tropicibacter sp. R15_0]|uniref:KpsF/GutQ family sugar-phosphate isomerase n=1 Tax=Tropicibacter sp. R15_0 TaxID=2821101 RepID=UPI001ADC598C|nr:KpsF/GutQ family sugar-phosphate isomerase [Tropicibacter sp. R15_0]MBO9468085.1 KpsF/GutQ family sugar-phosphate isomerase [Tropicibacter sp. R15_0]